MSDELKTTVDSVASMDLFGIWVDVSAQKPVAGKKVIACGRYSWSGKSWRTVATWQPARSIDAEFWDDPPDEWWDAEGNHCTNPDDMWLEEAIESEMSYILSGVTHWMPLPDVPNASPHSERACER
jgi:hypothetical protein